MILHLSRAASVSAMRPLRKQAGFLMIQLALVATAFAFIFLRYSMMLADDAQYLAAQSQGKRVATVASAIRQAMNEGDSLTNWNVPGARFRNGAVHDGTDWLKGAACVGGTAPVEYLDCTFEDAPILGLGSRYRSTIANDGATITVTLTVTGPLLTQGLVLGSEPNIYISCLVSQVAEGSLGQAQFAHITSGYLCDQNGVTTITINANTGSADFLSIAGLNSPVADIDWDGFNVDNMGQLEVGQIVDADDNGFILNLNGTSTLNAANITNVDVADTTRTRDLTVTRRINQTNATIVNNMSGALEVGGAGNLVAIEDGSVYLSGALVASADSNYFLAPRDDSRVKDIRLASRGNYKLSTLLPNYVNKGAVMSFGGDSSTLIINKPSCTVNGDVGQPRIVITPQEGRLSIHDSNNKNAGPETATNLLVVSQPTRWQIAPRYFSFSTGSWQLDTNARLVSTLYCYYPY